ncbi:MAG: ankyrin repeat protein [Cognaticolwellia sp.]|jgi:ankyrin repeat protein
MMSPLMLALSLSSTAEADPNLCSAVKASSTSSAPLKRALEAGADPNQQCSYQINHVPDAMFIASVIILPLLPLAILAGRPHNPPALSVAILRGRPAYVELLLEYGADPLKPSGKRAPAPLPLAVGKDLGRGGTRYTGLLLAEVDQVPARLMVHSESLDALLDNPALWRLLVDKGLDLKGYDDNGQTWMTRALSRGDMTAVRFLVEQDAPLDSGPLLLQASLNYTKGTAPLRWVLDQEGLVLDLDQGLAQAAENGHAGAFALLRESGAHFPSSGLGAAVSSGRVDWVRLALADGVVLESDGPISLGEQAVEAGHTEVVALLVEKGVVWTPGRTPTSALQEGDLRRVDLALSMGWQPQAFELALACEKGSPSFVRALMVRGAPAQQVALGAAVAHENAQVVRLLLDEGLHFPDSAVPDIVEAQRLDWLKLAMEQGVRLDASDLSGEAAVLAVAWGDPDAVALLKRVGAKMPEDWSPTILLWNEDLRRLDMALELGYELGEGEVNTAVWNNDLGLLQALLDRGAPPSGRALMAALRDEESEMVQLLLQAGAVFPQDSLSALIQLGDPALLERALAQGVDLQSYGGSPARRPAEMAVMDGDEALWAMLLAAGVRWHEWDDLDDVLAMDDPRRLGAALDFGAELDGSELGVMADTVVSSGPASGLASGQEELAMLQAVQPRLSPEQGAQLLIQLYDQRPDLAADLGASAPQFGVALVASLSPRDSARRTWLLEQGGRYPNDCLTQAAAQADLATLAQVLGQGVVQGKPYRNHPDPVWAAISRGQPAMVSLLDKHDLRLPPESDLEPWWRDGGRESTLELALSAGAQPSAVDVEIAARMGKMEVLDILVLHLHDPADWQPKWPSDPDANERVAQIQGEKRRAQRDAKRAARRSRFGPLQRTR